MHGGYMTISAQKLSTTVIQLSYILKQKRQRKHVRGEAEASPFSFCIAVLLFEESANRDALVGTGGPAPCRAALPDR